jgi:hypothetical protein
VFRVNLEGRAVSLQRPVVFAGLLQPETLCEVIVGRVRPARLSVRRGHPQKQGEEENQDFAVMCRATAYHIF